MYAKYDFIPLLRDYLKTKKPESYIHLITQSNNSGLNLLMKFVKIFYNNYDKKWAQCKA